MDYWELLAEQEQDRILKRSLTSNKNMSNLWAVNWKDVAGAVVSGVVVAVLALIGNTTNIFTLDFHQVVSVAIVAGITSLLKALATDNEGKLAGVLPVK